MKKGFHSAKQAVAEHLAAASLPVMLFSLSVIADQAAMRAGRTTELYSSLFDYERLLPAGYCGFWKKTGEDGGLFVVDRTGNREDYRPLPGVFDVAVDMGWIEAGVS